VELQANSSAVASTYVTLSEPHPEGLVYATYFDSVDNVAYQYIAVGGGKLGTPARCQLLDEIQEGVSGPLTDVQYDSGADRSVAKLVRPGT
jgi:hypothetical protein